VRDAVDFWREALSIPLDRALKTEEELAAARAEHQARLAVLVHSKMRGDARAIQIARDNLAATVDVLTILTPSLDARLATAKMLNERQKACREWFTDSVECSQEALERLAAAGADIVYVLDILINHVRRGAEVPTPASLKFSGRLAPTKTAGGAASAEWPPGAADEGVVISAPVAHGRIRTRPPARRKTGPAETEITYAMALLAHHLRQTAGSPHWTDLAELFTWWALRIRREGRISGRHVKRRVLKIRTRDPFRRLARLQPARRRALKFAFDHFCSAKMAGSTPLN